MSLSAIQYHVPPCAMHLFRVNKTGAVELARATLVVEDESMYIAEPVRTALLPRKVMAPAPRFNLPPCIAMPPPEPSTRLDTKDVDVRNVMLLLPLDPMAPPDSTARLSVNVVTLTWTLLVSTSANSPPPR